MNRYCRRGDESQDQRHYWQSVSRVNASRKVGPCLNHFESHTMSIMQFYWTENEETWGRRILIEGYLLMFTEKASFDLFYTVCAGLATRTVEHIYSTSIWRPAMGKILCTDTMAEDRYKKKIQVMDLTLGEVGRSGGREVRRSGGTIWLSGT